jgi:hypothetical protein
MLSLVTAWAPGLFLPAYSDTQPELKKFNPQIVGEPGCPVEMVGASTEMELDPFGAPVAARHYIDYRNAGNRPIVAVKFRIGYVGADGKINQPYVNGDDQQQLDPGQMGSKKWRGDKVDPRTTAVKIRVLKVKFADGSVWESVKLNETNSQQQSGFAPLSIESPGGDGFSGGQPVPFRDYGQQGFQGFPKNAGSVPLTQTPGQANNGGLYQSGPTPGEYPTRAPAGQYTGGGAPPAAAAQPYASPAGSANADFAPFMPSSAPDAASAGMPPSTGSAPVRAPVAPTAAAAPSSGSSLPAYTRPSQVTLPAAPTDPMSEIDSILGTSKQPPKTVAPATPPSGAAPATGQPTSAAPAAQATAQAARAASSQSPALRPTLTPGQPASDDSAAKVAPGDGDKSVDLR